MIIELLLAGAAFMIFKYSGKQTRSADKITTPTIRNSKIEHAVFPAIDANKQKILDKARSRGIKHLVHFTQAANISSIKTHGLRSRLDLRNLSLPFNFNDDQRLDGYLNSVSLSVTSTNYKMFYRYRKLDNSVRWAVILLDACEILQNCDCAFQYTNAANHAVRSTPIESRKNFAAFEAMFYDDDNLRKIRNLQDNEPTDPQAEILCFDTIPPEFIRDIVFGGELFSYRHDWEYWKKIC